MLQSCIDRKSVVGKWRSRRRRRSCYTTEKVCKLSYKGRLGIFFFNFIYLVFFFFFFCLFVCFRFVTHRRPWLRLLQVVTCNIVDGLCVCMYKAHKPTYIICLSHLCCCCCWLLLSWCLIFMQLFFICKRHSSRFTPPHHSSHYASTTFPFQTVPLPLYLQMADSLTTDIRLLPSDCTLASDYSYYIAK